MTRPIHPCNIFLHEDLHTILPIMNVDVSFSTGYKMKSFSGVPFDVVFPLNTPDLFYFYRNTIRGLHYIGKN